MRKKRVIYGLELKFEKKKGSVSWRLFQDRKAGEMFFQQWEQQRLQDYDPECRDREPGAGSSMANRGVFRDFQGSEAEDAESLTATCYFYPEEAALERARGMMRTLAVGDKTGMVQKAMEREWMAILSPDYDSSWFLGSLEEDIWEMVMVRKMKDVLDEIRNPGCV